MHDNVRICSYYLLFRRKLGALFEFEVSNGARKGEVAIDPTEVDETTGSDDPGLFACRGSMTRVSIQLQRVRRATPTFVLRLMIKGQWLGPALHSQDTSRVTSIRLERIQLAPLTPLGSFAVVWREGVGHER